MNLDCIFCKIGSGELPAYKVYEDERTLAFLDINPIAKGHTLVLSKSHARSLTELSPETLQELMSALQRVVKAIEKALTPEGLNIFINQGEVAGQVVPHLHIHVVPREKGNGMDFVTPHVELSEDEFKELRQKIEDNV